MKKIILFILIFILILFGLYKIQSGTIKLGASYNDDAKSIMVGSSSDCVPLPTSAVFANATTTVAGDKIIQKINTAGIEEVILNMAAIGGTPTSTMFVRQMGSFDGINYFDLSTTTDSISATSTLVSTPRAIQWDPGTATSSKSVVFNTKGYKFTRFIMWCEDLATDPNDGVQAWVEQTSIEGLR